MRAELLYPAEALLGEGPCWDADAGALIWVDILSRQVTVARDDERHEYVVPAHVGAAVPRAGGGLLLAMGLSFATLALDTGAVEAIASVPGDASELRMNDGKADPAGRFWAGTMAYSQQPGEGTLFRLEREGVARPVLEGLTVSNGLAWTPGGDTLFFIDSPTRTVVAFEVESDGGLGTRRLVVDTAEFEGVPDGLTADDDGNLWVGFFAGAAVRCFSPSGELLEVVEVPATHATSCCFAGPSRDRLCITTARYGLSATELREEPLAGCVLVVTPGVSGPAATPARVDPA